MAMQRVRAAPSVHSMLRPGTFAHPLMDDAAGGDAESQGGSMSCPGTIAHLLMDDAAGGDAESQGGSINSTGMIVQVRL